MPPGEMLFIGDSLTEHFDWAARFPAHRVHNLGISGEMVGELRDRLARGGLGVTSPEMVFVMSGINDVAMEEPAIAGPYRDVIRHLRKLCPGAVIYLQSILPAELPWLGPGAIEAINDSLREVAASEGARYLDIYAHFIEAGVRECLSPDGVHLSDFGYEVWAGALEPTIDGAP